MKAYKNICIYVFFFLQKEEIYSKEKKKKKAQCMALTEDWF